METTFHLIQRALVPNRLLLILGFLLGSSSAHCNDIVQIPAALRDVMGLATEEVGPAMIPKTLSCVGRVEPIPGKHYLVTSRVPGRVIALAVVEGQSVVTDDLLVEIETRQPGNPPPKLALRSPFSGIVTKVSVIMGQGVEAGQTLIEVANLDEVYARAEVFESLIGEIPAGAKAVIRAQAYPNELFAGTLERLGGEVNPANGALPAWFRMVNMKHLLRPGALVEFRVITSETNANMTIPVSALLGTAASPFVYVTRDKEGFLYRRAVVELGARSEDRVEILKGLAPGNRVVSANAHLLGLSPSGDAPKNSHGHDHGEHEGHDHGGHGKDEGKSFQWNTFVIWWLFGGLGLSVLLNLFLLRRRRNGQVTSVKSS
ncbi:MAG: efflux RND transporter periplasmic adaptor subunit [Opitutales bacterium]|jgi:membrane fusion protein, heavy metal efflux system